nr:hypothetical protein [Tanacetum cinerariifolium]
IEPNDQAIQTILLGLPEDIYAAFDSFETGQEIWLRVQQIMKGSDIGIQEKKAKLFNEWERGNRSNSIDDNQSNEGSISCKDLYHSIIIDQEQLCTYPRPLPDLEAFLVIFVRSKFKMGANWDVCYKLFRFSLVLGVKELQVVALEMRLGRGWVENCVEISRKIIACSKNRPPMLNKENYVPWSSRFLRYAKSIPYGKLIHNSIINGPYVRRTISEPGDLNREVLVNETFHVQTDDELTDKELKQIEDNDQAIQTILLGLPEDIYAAIDSCETAQEIWQIAQSGINMGQDGQIQMVRGNGKNQFRQYAGKNVGNLNAYNAIQNVRNQVAQNPRVQNVRNHNGLIGVPGNPNLNGNVDLDEIKEFNANCILMANLQQASTSSTQTDKALVYDSDGSPEVHNYENCNDNEIFNMFIQEEHYTELLEPIPEPHQVPQNDHNVISEVTSVELSGETVEQHPTNFEETRALYDSLYQNLEIKVEKVNSVNRKLKETNAELTTELARFKNQKKCFEISQEKYDKLERCYQQFVYQEQCLSKKINALHLSFDKQIMTLNEEISDPNKQLSKEKSTVSFLLEEKKRLKSDFKTREDKLLDKQIQLDKKIKELNNILVKMGQSIQTIHVLSPKPD